MTALQDDLDRRTFIYFFCGKVNETLGNLIQGCSAFATIWSFSPSLKSLPEKYVLLHLKI